jgi:hypothetical protein
MTTAIAGSKLVVTDIRSYTSVLRMWLRVVPVFAIDLKDLEKMGTNTLRRGNLLSVLWRVHVHRIEAETTKKDNRSSRRTPVLLESKHHGGTCIPALSVRRSIAAVCSNVVSGSRSLRVLLGVV